jgi:hypothetical protein
MTSLCVNETGWVYVLSTNCGQYRNHTGFHREACNAGDKL